MKGEILYKILNSLADHATDSVDFARTILQSGYGASSSKINYQFSKIQNKRHKRELDQQDLYKFKRYLSKLKIQGLILENNQQLFLTREGEKKLAYFQSLPSFNKNLYKGASNGRVTVVSYDIPVAFNRERSTLRSLLKMMDFHLVHKSVWIGMGGVSEKFIKDLQRLRIIDYVEILEVTKNGTLKSLN